MKLSNLTLYGFVLGLSQIHAAMADVAEDFISFNDLTVTIDIVSIPEPATLAMFGIGVVGAMVAARKRNKK